MTTLQGLVERTHLVQMCIRDRDAAKVMPVCPKCGKATRVGHIVNNGKKVRVCKKCGAEF